MQELLHVLLGSQVGGCEVNSLNVVRGLQQVTHCVGVLGPPGPMCSAWREVGAEVIVCGENRPLGERQIGKTVEELMAERRPDAVIIWHGMVKLPEIIRALNPLGIPVAVHGGNPAHTMPRWVDWKYLLLEAIYPPRGPLPTYICCSQYVADSFQTSRYLRRFRRVVVPNGVAVPSGPTHVPREIAASQPAVIGMVARLSSIKDHATLVRAVVAVRRKFPRAVLELAGDGDERQSLESLVAELDLGDAVCFLGDVADIYGRMATWDLFAYATTENEGLGNAVAEAMMFGLPCVVTDVGPMREFAGPGDAARLVPPANPTALADAICGLLADVAARRELSTGGQTFASQRFNPATFSRKYAEILGLKCDVESCTELKSGYQRVATA